MPVCRPRYELKVTAELAHQLQVRSPITTPERVAGQRGAIEPTLHPSPFGREIERLDVVVDHTFLPGEWCRATLVRRLNQHRPQGKDPEQILQG